MTDQTPAQTKLTKIDAGFYRVTVDGQHAGLVELNEETGEWEAMKKGCLVVDVSCDLAMGFPFARPTSFDEPVFDVGDCVYYAVNHSPSWLWRSASWEISRVVVPFVETVLGGPAAWEGNETVRRAIEIRDGEVRNEKILSFQNREKSYPHEFVSVR